MAQKERREYILNLDKVVKRWSRNSKLFCGGCCFSAGQVAKLLEQKHIRYKVVCWESGTSGEYGEYRLKKIIEQNNCCHIAIQVSLDSKPFIIGGNFYGSWVTSIITYSNIKSKQLVECDLHGVKHDTWNNRYDRSLNKRLINILTKSVEK